jgi:hypothetical protein
MTSNNITIDELTLFCAVRYTLGRKTYIVSHIVDEVLKNWDKLSDGFKRQLIKEIKQYKKEHSNIGMECDEQTWQKIIDKYEMDR